MADERAFNINQKVRVRLTPMGEKVYNDYHKLLNIAPYNKGPVLELQLWNAMEIFGMSLCCGGPVLFENNELVFLEEAIPTIGHRIAQSVVQLRDGNVLYLNKVDEPGSPPCKRLFVHSEQDLESDPLKMLRDVIAAAIDSNALPTQRKMIVEQIQTISAAAGQGVGPEYASGFRAACRQIIHELEAEASA